MPTLYHSVAPDSAERRRVNSIQETLQEIVIAYDTILVKTPADLPPELPLSMNDLPILADDGKLYVDPVEIDDHLDELRDLMANWDRFQSDSCHIEDDGTICGPYGVDNMKGPGISAMPFRNPTHEE